MSLCIFVFASALSFHDGRLALYKSDSLLSLLSLWEPRPNSICFCCWGRCERELSTPCSSASPTSTTPTTSSSPLWSHT